MTVLDEIRRDILDFQDEYGRKPNWARLTRGDLDEFAKLDVSQFPLAPRVARKGVEQVVKELDGVKVIGWDATARDYAVGAVPTRVTAATVRARVADWIDRLDGLFDQVEQWAAEIPGATADRSTMTQQVEGLMVEHSVSAREVPVLTVFIGRERISFVPSALWIVGANGRVNVTTNRRQYAMVDLGGNGQPSQWWVVVSVGKTSLAAFNRHLFERLVAGRL